jgi:hypothetical protein
LYPIPDHPGDDQAFAETIYLTIKLLTMNVGIYDQGTRTLLAITIAALYFFRVIEGTVAQVLLIIAGIFVLTSLFGFCPLYKLFHINTTEHSST